MPRPAMTHHRPFIVYDPLASEPPDQQPSWYPPLRAVLDRRFALPWTEDVAEAARSCCVLALTSELDAQVCQALAPAGAVVVLFSGLYAQKFTAVTPSIADLLAEEAAVCDWMSIGLVPSRYARDLLVRTYGAHLRPRLHALGWPIDIDAFAGAPTASRDMKQILLGQRQDYDKNFLLEADIVTELVGRGYRVVRAASRSNPAVRDFALYAERHLGVPQSGEPARYVEQCRESGFVLLTSPAETLCATAIEATAAGCIPVVPDHTAFREWCHPDNRYEPFSIAAILRILAEQPVRDHRIAQYRSEQVVARLHALIADQLRELACHPRATLPAGVPW